MIIRTMHVHTPIKSKSWAVRRANELYAKVCTAARYSFTKGGMGRFEIGISPLGGCVTIGELDLPDTLPANEVRIFLNYMSDKSFSAEMLILPLTRDTEPV